MEVIDGHKHSVAILPPQVDEVAVFGTFTFGEDEQFPPSWRSSSPTEARLRTPGTQLSLAVISAAAAANSS